MLSVKTYDRFSLKEILVNKSQLKFLEYSSKYGLSSNFLLKDFINFQVESGILDTIFRIGCLNVDSDLKSKYKDNLEKIEKITKDYEKFQKFQITLEDQKMTVHARVIQFDDNGNNS